MSLTRKFLTAMGIEADKVDEIISAHAETVDALKEERDKAKNDRDKYKADAEKLPDVEKELNDLKEKVKEGNKDPYEPKYNDLKAEFDKYSSQLEQFKEKIKISWLAVDSLTKAEKQFVGFKVFHNYRADNNAGNTLIGNHVLFVDPNIENVFFSMDMEEYNGFQESIKQFLEQAESLNLESE